MKNEDQCGRRGLGGSKSNSGALPDSRPLIWTKPQIAASLPHFAKDPPDMACGRPAPRRPRQFGILFKFHPHSDCHLFSIYPPFICGTALIAGQSEKVSRHMQWRETRMSRDKYAPMCETSESNGYVVKLVNIVKIVNLMKIVD